MTSKVDPRTVRIKSISNGRKQPVLPPDNPISLSGFPSDKLAKIAKDFLNMCIVSVHGADCDLSLFLCMVQIVICQCFCAWCRL